jgi:hypothetical protein
MDAAQLKSFGTRYTAAWCSQDAASVAALFSEAGSLQINNGPPSVGRTAITAAAQGFMTAFPDMIVTMDGVDLQGDRAAYRWTLTGTNAGPGGSGKAVRISGYEEWRFGRDGLIAESKGHFDEADYKRQLSADASEQLSLSALVPMAFVRSVSRSIEFYGKLGFVEGNTHTPEGAAEPSWVWLKCGGAHLMLAQATDPIDPQQQAILFYVYCDDVAGFRSRLLESGVDAGPITHPFYAPGGEFRVADPDGYALMVSHT